jgi:hypothetical protein
MVSRYPNAASEYDQKQLDQLTKTLVTDLIQMSQPIGLGYSSGAFAPMKTLTGGGTTAATGSVGSVDIMIDGSIDVAVTSGRTQNGYNIAQVVAALITDLQNRGMLG